MGEVSEDNISETSSYHVLFTILKIQKQIKRIRIKILHLQFYRL